MPPKAKRRRSKDSKLENTPQLRKKLKRLSTKEDPEKVIVVPVNPLNRLNKEIAKRRAKAAR